MFKFKLVIVGILLSGAIYAMSAEMDQFQKPTKRMEQIQETFGIKMMCILRSEEDKKKEKWVFVQASDDRLFHYLPIVVPKDATDREVQVAIEASLNCAAFYEMMIKKATDAQKPSAMLIPTF